MFGLFKRKNEPGNEQHADGKVNDNSSLDLSIFDETISRWETFASKIKERADELYEQGFAEAVTMKQTATNNNDNDYYLFWSGVGGQIAALREKAKTTFETKVVTVFEEEAGEYMPVAGRYRIAHEHARDLLFKLQEQYNALDDYLLEKSCTNIDDFDKMSDPQDEYNKILDYYETVKNKFTCSNCGAAITISKIFCIATYVDCSFCHTKNTFQPGDIAYTLPAVAEKLAEKHTKTLKQKWESFAAAIPQWTKENSDEWYHQKKEEAALYAAYIHSKFDEVDKLVPDLKAQHDLIRNARINEMLKRIQ